MDTPNPKRPRHDVSSPSQNPDSDPDFNQSDFDSTISSFLLLPDSPDSPDSTSIGSSFDRVLGQVLVSASEASGDDSVQDRLIDRAGNLAFLLLESTKRFSRMRASLYNYNSWPLPQDLTINVFSMLDTKSLMQASACCTMFRKCSKDPLCYSHIDLKMVGKRIYDGIVCSMIHKAGKELRSLKLGRVISSRKGSTFTRSCLASVILNHGFNGGLLRSLQLYNLVSTGTKSLCDMLSVCPNLTELKIANFDRRQILEQILKTLTRNPRLIIERLLIQNNIDFLPASGISCSTVEAFVTSCPSLTWLTLVGFKLKEVTVRKLAEGFPKLTHMNLSRTPEISGRFLRDLRNRCREPPLKTLILRDCPSLDEREIGHFLDALLNGHFKFIRHIDLTSHVGGEEVTISKDIMKKLKEERSAVNIIAKTVFIISGLDK
ncbi:PREDICTED: F-box protein At4g02760-like [Camelina sativa]|uniref:F-box protein At4g02760-like n=1 Tax=Camelina sativa TaxID=90675 RepID=A0ABM0T8M5_CAMSA|nr:PREDICTED: F-box protein At4g02760-like [Camelina sativa]